MAAKKGDKYRILLCFILILVTVEDTDTRRTKRSLAQLTTMVECATKNSWMLYINYGCYCGPGGNGQPVDDIDRCCQAHDRCYDVVMAGMKCLFSFEVYFLSYHVTRCFNCRSTNSACAMAICQCDSVLAKCLMNKKINKRYKLYDKLKCR